MSKGPSSYQTLILGAIQTRQIYGGTVDGPVKKQRRIVTVAERRAKNRLARRARRITRLHSK